MITHRHVETNGIKMHLAEAGEGPLVVLLHGFPEGWYSWRHQLVALADAGFHAVAPDQRGYGQTDAPADIGAYAMLRLVGDVVGLLGVLEESPAVVVGHDWGAPVAWNTALFRPDLVRGVVGLSVPFRPRGSLPPLVAYRKHIGDRFYQLYFQEPGVAEKELDQDPARTMRSFLFAASGDSPELANMMVGDEGWVAGMSQPERLPAWLSEADIDHFAAEFERTGFRGGLNWYRNIDRNWAESAPWQGAKVTVPALYAVGDRDPVYHFPGGKDLAAGLKKFVPNLTATIVLEGCGHWIQQERPEAVNEALLEFLKSLEA
ncbi:MAG TPA: alpha/beta hydrolase [Candidatus Dormibacteraeota bacterium]|nr:alpha/beta hydrolase [Candidatus Dormibacteraeota bacterium]